MHKCPTPNEDIKYVHHPRKFTSISFQSTIPPPPMSNFASSRTLDV